jgi:hypothetical protein
MFERWRESIRAGRLRQAERALKDAVHRWEHWSFGHTPSQKEDDRENIYGLIRRVEELGGDALDVIDYSYRHMLSYAMPDTFEQVRASHGNGWDTVRKEAA